MVGLVGTQAIALGVLGGALGLGLTLPAATVLDAIAAELVGFEGLVRTPDIAFVACGVIAIGIGAVGAVVVGWRISRLNLLSQLQ